MKQAQLPRMMIGFVAVFALFQWLASELESFRGEFGVIVGIVVAGATVAVERYLFRSLFADAAKAVGLGRPNLLGLVVAFAISAVMLLTVPLFASGTDATFSLYPKWQWLIVGLFFQAGIAEETLFRGYLFGHMRQRYTFWTASALAAIPFVLVHLILFYSLPWSLAVVSILLSIVMSFPFSKLYEIGGDTIWAPAIVHFAAQAIAKLFVADGESASLFPFACIAVTAVVPLAVFLYARIGAQASLPATPR